MNIQWYPGHMTKAKRAMKEDIKLIDLIIELVDARVPLSSRNPDIDVLGAGKARIVLLNKSDLADERCNSAWESYFVAKGCHVVK
ncbi:MAG TPA: ribosome biogenesis GTPase YlqF, partial [Lachnoclostridium sp.]|nr:ribosome biogenesis GTPase YlqF [Lachnoclostridium sp.]